jgi:alkaline phosphatase D
MRISRRQFLAALARTGLAAPGLALSSSCAPALLSSDRETGLSLGYVAGEVTENSAVIWLRGEPESLVAMHYGENPGVRDYVSLDPLPVDAGADNTAQFYLEKLEPATRYYYRAVVLGKRPGPVASFVTAPDREDSRKVVFCFSGDTRDTYQPFSVLRAVRAQNPDFFLHLGDTIYADSNGIAKSLPEFWSKYRANRSDAAAQALHSSTCVYATWDDHEVANNYLPGHPLAGIGQKAFFDYWPIRRDGAEPSRLYRSFRWGRALEIFILDTRQYRDRAGGTMLGSRQKNWLMLGLDRSTAIFKFVATSVTLAGGGRDRWDGYPAERAEILQFIKNRRIPGVIFLSADLHYAAIAKVPNGNGMRDISAGPLGAPLNRITNGSASRFEFFLAENFNFAKISVDPSSKPPHADVEFIDQDNYTFHRARIGVGQ